jgi:hypothetical protein
MSKSTFPKTVKRGNVRVKIYLTPSNGCEAYTVAYYFGGKRIRKTFADRGLAELEAETMAKVGGRTKNHVRKHLKNLCHFAQRRGYLPNWHGHTRPAPALRQALQEQVAGIREVWRAHPLRVVAHAAILLKHGYQGQHAKVRFGVQVLCRITPKLG